MRRLVIAVLIVGAGAALALASPAAAGALGASRAQASSALVEKLHEPVPDALLGTLATASHKGLGLVTRPPDFRLQKISGPALGVGDKVGLLYIGADFCPYCAGQRWGIILTLLRFGEFEGLRYMLSSPTDVYANTPTFSFRHADYHSRHLAFQAVEIRDRMGAPLMTPDELQKKIYTTFDRPPYVPGFGLIPFVYLGGDYMLTRLMVHPRQLDGMNWRQIASALANPQSRLFQAVMPRVNLMTAAICRLSGGQPADVCASPGVVAANALLLGQTPKRH